MTEKLIITACICGAEVTKEQNPAVPYTVAEIAREAQLAYLAGASIIHLHVRNDDGTPTQSTDRYKACIDAILQLCPDVIVQVSTGGSVDMKYEERMQPLLLHPEMATLDCGTCNFGYDDIFVNTQKMIVDFAHFMKEHHIKPELEVFDKGMVDTVLHLHEKGIIAAPMHFDFVLGVSGAMAATERNLEFMAGSLPAGSTWTASGIGRYEFPVIEKAIALGGHVRVGLEDNLYIAPKELASSNGVLVEKAVMLAKKYNRDIASPQEARNILHI